MNSETQPHILSDTTREILAFNLGIEPDEVRAIEVQHIFSEAKKLDSSKLKASRKVLDLIENQSKV